MAENKFASQFNQENVEIKSVEPVYNGFFKINQFTFTHALFNGGQSEVVSREIFERGHAVAVLPYDPIQNKVVLIEQIRIGALATKQSPWLLEVVAGMIDKPEETSEVAIREAQEEAGLTINKLIPILDYLSSPGGTTERVYLYLGIVDCNNAAGIFGLDEEQEDIKAHVFDYNDAIDLLNSGELDNAATVICMQWLALNKSKLDKEFELDRDEV
ncbi:ADP-ribose pyrophosphatase [Psychrosphaera saromensis]|uniref:ADP-ribose pyrophosphatase n=1 Tax=Psychrosphaera saromensis TaxID=716813 RepID=A0A2S7UVC3_9GAMM|nr:ADP-ribose diphosphatase [Psychrosphaera saromensis]PQJ53709.1 ADP-ribose diphosphatase [Psychrosphaera saromensis]GHB62990.1 ADP-ribose pyrophosphatase [Psychrosphaera saromensis]GLQ15514.1 ADP-ribose pyrophosphatase [Psychrosphaera saromensis]